MRGKRYRGLLGIAAALAAIGCASAGSAAQGPPEGGPPADPLAPDLFQAIGANRIAQVNELLEKGAKTEARNWLGITPLLWAASRGNNEACMALIAHKADVNGDSIYGGPVEFAVMSGNPKVVKLLLDRGARFSDKRSDKITAVMDAADGGHVEILRMLLLRKPDVNAVDGSGATALMQAARRGQATAAQILVDAGADVNLADSYGRTPLMAAALNGYPKVASLLISRGAKVNERDRAGDTALSLTARYSGDPVVAELLAKAGADRSGRDSHGTAIAQVALRRGYKSCALAIDPSVRADKSEFGSAAERARRAALLSLSLIERTTHNFTEHSGCVSCHHQGIGLMATGAAQSLGYTIDKRQAASEVKMVTAEAETRIADLRNLVPHPEMYKYLVAVDMNELSPEVGSTLSGLAAHGVARSEVTELLATVLGRQQMQDGSWRFGYYREPIQSGPFTFTAYALRVMSSYWPDSLDAERKQRIEKARAWLIATAPKTNEDRAFRLAALKWAGAPQSEIDRATAAVRKSQRPDGGWAQFDSAEPAGACFARSDAYATGEALYALHIADIKTTDSVYRRGVDYLIRTQDEDGSWFVNKRAVPANNYFETGFPHGESQFISYSATCYATMALMYAADSKGTKSLTVR